MKIANGQKQTHEILYDKADELIELAEKLAPKAYVKIEIYFHSGLYRTTEHNTKSFRSINNGKDTGD